MATPLPLYLDCDTGIDDAIALTYLLGHEGLELAGIGTVSGNVSAVEAARNTSALLRVIGRTGIPVAIGEHDPLHGEYDGGAPHVHGTNGIGEVELEAGPDAVAETAPEMLVRLARELGGQLSVLAIGPLTNIARALELEPELPRLVSRLTVMGGAVWAPGNITPFAEANIANDPEAARIVLGAGFSLALVPLDVTLQHRFDDDDAARLEERGTGLHVALGRMLRRYIDFYEQIGLPRESPLHDPLAAAIASREVAGTEVRKVVLDVVLDGEERGRTVPSAADGAEAPAVDVVVGADAGAAEAIRRRIHSLDA